MSSTNNDDYIISEEGLLKMEEEEKKEKEVSEEEENQYLIEYNIMNEEEKKHKIEKEKQKKILEDLKKEIENFFKTTDDKIIKEERCGLEIASNNANETNIASITTPYSDDINELGYIKIAFKDKEVRLSSNIKPPMIILSGGKKTDIYPDKLDDFYRDIVKKNNNAFKKIKELKDLKQEIENFFTNTDDKKIEEEEDLIKITSNNNNITCITAPRNSEGGRRTISISFNNPKKTVNLYSSIAKIEISDQEYPKITEYIPLKKDESGELYWYVWRESKNAFNEIKELEEEITIYNLYDKIKGFFERKDDKTIQETKDGKIIKSSKAKKQVSIIGEEIEILYGKTKFRLKPDGYHAEGERKQWGGPYEGEQKEYYETILNDFNKAFDEIKKTKEKNIEVKNKEQKEEETIKKEENVENNNQEEEKQEEEKDNLLLLEDKYKEIKNFFETPDNKTIDKIKKREEKKIEEKDYNNKQKNFEQIIKSCTERGSIDVRKCISAIKEQYYGFEDAEKKLLLNIIKKKNLKTINIPKNIKIEQYEDKDAFGNTTKHPRNNIYGRLKCSKESNPQKILDILNSV